MGSDVEGNAGSIPTMECPGHHDNTRGGQPPPPTVPPV